MNIKTLLGALRGCCMREHFHTGLHRSATGILFSPPMPGNRQSILICYLLCNISCVKSNDNIVYVVVDCIKCYVVLYIICFIICSDIQYTLNCILVSKL